MPQEVLSFRREFRYLIAGTVLLVGLNVLNEMFGRPSGTITRLIYLGHDNNMAAWFSSMLLAVAGLLSYECSVRAKQANMRGGLSFLLLAGLLFAMSADKIAMIHESVGELAKNKFELSSSSLAQHSPLWIISPMVIGLFVAFVTLLRRTLAEAPGSLTYLIPGFSSIVLGGIVLETTINFLNHDDLQWVWDIENIVEEGLEMAGTLLIMAALLTWRSAAERPRPLVVEMPAGRSRLPESSEATADAQAKSSV
ncbi:MAG: hypothetical protein ACYTGZ_01865 [Planctomycetota bacterium]|jgi:hypothetical protein